MVETTQILKQSKYEQLLDQYCKWQNIDREDLDEYGNEEQTERPTMTLHDIFYDLEYNIYSLCRLMSCFATKTVITCKRCDSNDMAIIDQFKDNDNPDESEWVNRYVNCEHCGEKIAFYNHKTHEVNYFGDNVEFG